jgi:uncharacterized membrane protein YfcA
MFRDPQMKHDTHIVRASVDPHVTAASSEADDAERLAVAQQRRAEHVRTMLAGRFRWLVRARVTLVALAIALASAVLLIAYARLLSGQGVPASIPALSAVLLAATLSGIAGFAFSAICGVMLLQIISDPIQVVEIMMVCSIAIQMFSVVVFWRDIDWRALMPFLLGGPVGVPVGVWLLLHLGNVWFKEAVGGLLVAYAVQGLFKRPLAIRSNSWLADACVGFLGGITGGFAGFPGSTVTIWCGIKGWSKQRQRAIYQPFILIMQILALLLLQSTRPSGMLDAGPGFDPLQFIPAALLGTWFGLTIFRRMSDRSFGLTVNVLLLVSGIGLLA